MDIYLGATLPNMTADQVWNAGQLAAGAWSHSSIACTGLTISLKKQAEATADVGLDGKNVIVFRTDTWCAQPASDAQPCNPANAMAVTTLFKNKTTGEIVDADMEINAANFAWADLVADPELDDGSVADLQNTLTHELGHVIGLAHTCYSSSDGPAPLLDNTGNPELACSAPNLPASVTDATMYPMVPINDTDRRTLTPDDKQAPCDVYPSSAGVCGASSGSGCSVVGATDSEPARVWSVGLAGFLALALVHLAHRRSRASS